MTTPTTSMNRNFIGTLAGLAVIAAAVIFCIWPGMHSPLFADDTFQLEKSKSYVNWSECFNVDVFGYFRPVKNALFVAIAPLERHLEAWHWVGLTLYLGAAVGIHRIATICLGSGPIALLATTFWVLSPSCVSTALWLSCANISIGLIFAACVFHFHENLARDFSIGLLVTCCIFYALSLLCYESLIALPALLFVRDFQVKRLALNRQTLIQYGVYSLAALAFLVIRHEFAARTLGSDNLHAGLAPDTKAIHMSLSAPWFLWRHFLMWIFPFGTIEILGSYSWMRSASAASLILGWAFLVALLSTAAMTWKRFPPIAYGILFFVLANIPSGNFLPTFNGPIYDAYVTIPSIGLALALASTCDVMIRQYFKRKRESETGSIAVILVFSLLVAYRLPVCGAYFRYWAGVWGNPVELMLLTSETRPIQSQAKGYATVLLLAASYVDQADMIAKEVILEAPWDPTAKLTLARVAKIRNDLSLSEEHYRAIVSSPTASNFIKIPATIELAEVVANSHCRREEAADMLRRFLKTPVTNCHPRAIALLSRIYEQGGNLPKARATLERGLSLHPKDTELAKLLAAIDLPAPGTKPAAH